MRPADTLLKYMSGDLKRISENWCIFAEDMLRFGSIPSGKASFPCQDVALNLQYLCKRYAAAPDYPIARCRRGTSSCTHRCGGRKARQLRTKQYKTL